VQTEEGPKQKQKVVKKIPTEVIKNAKGLAIFTTMRTGLWVSGAGGSGILIARKDDGSWSPPSGILLHTAGLGFLVGVDIYDCVVVINSAEALEAFTKVRCTLGSEISVSAGPVGAGGVLDTEVHKRQAPIFTYLKSRGFYAGVQIDGTVIIERTDENERFYGQRIPVAEILEGKVRHPPYEIRRLLETIKAAQGDTDVDEDLLPTEPPPGDYEVDDGHIFGVPDQQDPDPYGVLALEKEGMSIKEAGTQKRASWEAFSFNPSPTSPVHNMYNRNSMEWPKSASRRNSWRASGLSGEPKTPSSLRNSMDFPPALPPRTPKRMSDMGTQTDDLPPPPSPDRSSMRSAASHSRNASAYTHPHMQEVPENTVLDTSPERNATASTQVNGYSTPPQTPDLQQGQSRRDDTAETNDDDTPIEEPVIQSVQSVQAVQPASPQVISKARLVDVPRRLPPKLPPRNPNRSGPMVIDASPKDATTSDTVDAETESKHDSAHESILEKPASIDNVKEKMDDVRLDDDADDEDDEPLRSNPWAKVEETKKRQSLEREAQELQETKQTTEAPALPGSFQ
jgi:lipid-binding SYLF domain-containing protein